MTAPAPPSRGRLLELLVELSFERREVVLASGQTSDFYIDCRQTALHPEGAFGIGHHLLDLVEALEATTGRTAGGVGGMTLGADPLATAVSLAAWTRGRHLPAFIVRKETKGHGTRSAVEGRRNLPDGTPVVMLEDAMTTGGSTLRAASTAREDGLDPWAVVSVVDRGAGAVERIEAAGYAVSTLFTPADLPL